MIAGVQSRDGQHLANLIIKAFGFEFGTVQGAFSSRSGTLASGGKRDIPPREWRTKFMRNIGEQARLGLDRSFKALGHDIEVEHQFGNFIAAARAGFTSASA